MARVSCFLSFYGNVRAVRKRLLVDCLYYGVFFFCNSVWQWCVVWKQGNVFALCNVFVFCSFAILASFSCNCSCFLFFLRVFLVIVSSNLYSMQSFFYIFPLAICVLHVHPTTRMHGNAHSCSLWWPMKEMMKLEPCWKLWVERHRNPMYMYVHIGFHFTISGL